MAGRRVIGVVKDKIAGFPSEISSTRTRNMQFGRKIIGRRVEGLSDSRWRQRRSKTRLT